MLELKNVYKEYYVASTTVKALNDINLQFRQNEFVAILGPSGCGKTTLLNIIGGLDRYTTGNLIIDKRSTKEYKDKDWDSYRNHRVGFVFQNYHLIPHLSVLENVELSLTLSGISKKERLERTKEVLAKVGLADKIHNKPTQLSGGQMQRVAIARALINDPDIILADEPTGALDSKTSVQIMEILKEISKEKLIIMVTHNPELADTYATRIIKLLDGFLTDDTHPFNGEYQEAKEQATIVNEKTPKTSMSFKTALSLSFKNLLTKKARTFMIALAGSIGIIGIALILALSSGFDGYIDRVQKDTLSTYPISITKENVDITALLSALMESQQTNNEHDMDKVYSNDIMVKMFNSLMAKVSINNLNAFKAFLDNDESDMKKYTSDIQYGYGIDLNIYADRPNEIFQINPSDLFTEVLGPLAAQSPFGTSTVTVWQEMLGNKQLLEEQYDVVHGRFPQSFDEVVIVLDENNEITDYTLYTLGLKDDDELKKIFEDIMNGVDYKPTPSTYTYEELTSLTFKLLLDTDYYQKNASGTYDDISENKTALQQVINNALTIKVVGIIKPNADTPVASITGSVAYTNDLTKYVINSINNTEIAKAQKANPDVDVLTNLPFSSKTITIEMINGYVSTLSASEQAMFNTLRSMFEGQVRAQYPQATDEQVTELVDGMIVEMFIEQYSDELDETTYENNLRKLGIVDLDSPTIINLYPIDFEAKESITQIIAEYNKKMEEEGKPENVINYSDYIDLMMSSISNIINAITYVLIGFVAISLIVSSIMIGIITYISVLERIKEIGILRSIGASKKDITQVFNAETLIIGFSAGMFGILVSLILIIPINMVISFFANIHNVAKLPVAGGVILVLISMFLTLIAGLIPSRIAANKDPVISLRSE